MRIAFFGSSLVSSWWNGAATYYRGLLGALARRGHAITFLEPAAFGRQQHRDIADPDWARVVVWPADEGGLAHALRCARDHDLIVKASGVGVFDAELEAAVLDLRRPGSSVVFWDVDAPATLARVHAAPGDPFLPLIPRYDAILTDGGGARVVAAYTALGARSCVPIYNALDPTTHVPAVPDLRFAGTLGLLANRRPDREARIGAFFTEAARRRPRDRFLLGGSGWDEADLPANVRRLGHVGTADHNRFNSSVLAVLSVNRDSMADFGFSPPSRIFEAAGAGACIVSDAWAGIDSFLDPGAEILIAADGKAVAEHVGTLDPSTARRIGRAARRRVLAHHTYEHRAGLVESVIAGGDWRLSA